MPLLHALEILAGQAAHRTLGEVLNDVHDQIAEGMPLDAAFARHPNVFSELTISMVRAGAEGAFLEDALYRTAHFLELQEQLKSRVKGAMAYPAFLAVAGFCVVVVLIVFFVPKFAGLFARLERQGTGLPMATIVLLWLSKYLGRYGLFLGAAVTALAVWLGGWPAPSTAASSPIAGSSRSPSPAGSSWIRPFPLLPRVGNPCCTTACRCSGHGNFQRFGR